MIYKYTCSYTFDICWPKYHVWIPLSYKLWSSQTHVYYMYVYLSSYLFIHDTYLCIVTQFIHIVEAIFIITILNQLFYVFIIHFFFVNNHSILSIPNQIQIIILLCGKVYFSMIHILVCHACKLEKYIF